MRKCTFCGAKDGQPHDRSIEHGDPYRRVFTGDVAQCGCRWTRGDILDLHGDKIGFGDTLHECPIHQAASQARPGRPGKTIAVFSVNIRNER